MRNLYEVLRQKEMDLERVRGEIEALRFIVPLLADGVDRPAPPAELARSTSPDNNRWPLKIDEPAKTHLDS